jgi:hypothetical protein
MPAPLAAPPDPDADYLDTVAVDPDAPPVGYSLEIDRRLWYAWKRTVRRDRTLYGRLAELLAADARSDGTLVERAAAADAEDVDDRLALLSIRRSAMRASQALGDDPDAAREELTQVLNTLDDRL